MSLFCTHLPPAPGRFILSWLPYPLLHSAFKILFRSYLLWPWLHSFPGVPDTHLGCSLAPLLSDLLSLNVAGSPYWSVSNLRADVFNSGLCLPPPLLAQGWHPINSELMERGVPGYSWGHLQEAGEEYGRCLFLQYPAPIHSPLQLAWVPPSPGPSPEEATAAFQLRCCTLSQPFLWLGQTCPIPSLLKGPTRIVALLRKRKFFS